MPPAVFLPCILHYLPFIQLRNTSGSARRVLWLLWGSSKTKLNEETFNEHLILGCKHNMIRPPGFQLCLLEKSKPLPSCLQAAEGKPSLFPHLHCPCVLLLQPCTAVTQGLSWAGTTGEPCQSWACLRVCTGKQVLLLRALPEWTVKSDPGVFKDWLCHTDKELFQRGVPVYIKIDLLCN